MKPVKDMTVGELAAFISSHLEKHGMEVVLSGGSCVTIFSRQQYVSAYLDFIERRSIKRKELRKTLEQIGFYEENRYFKHPETKMIVEFPSGPLAAGAEPIKDIIVMEFATGSLKLISPTECVKDRLAAYFHWQDRQSLAQAVLVAQSKEIDLSEIERWSKSEGKLQEFRKIRKQLVGEKAKSK
ncbi:MAG: hypothetical protein C4567_14980 [Deltaproteobacteria bacterium]|nr:MAG: hypothetical protein C4567_14980 [Deltaproteobacteria bacterium]